MIDGGDEDVDRHAVDGRCTREGTRAQRGPQPRLDQLIDHDLAIQALECVAAMSRELDRFFALVDLDHHGEQLALFAAIDGDDFTGRRGREAYAFVLLVGEEELAQFHLVPFPDLHGRLHADVVGAQDSHVTHGSRILDARLGRPHDGEIQAFLDFDHSLAQLMDRKCEGKGFEWIRILVESVRYQSGPKAFRTTPKKSPVL